MPPVRVQDGPERLSITINGVFFNDSDARDLRDTLNRRKPPMVRSFAAQIFPEGNQLPDRSTSQLLDKLAKDLAYAIEFLRLNAAGATDGMGLTAAQLTEYTGGKHHFDEGHLRRYLREEARRPFAIHR